MPVIETTSCVPCLLSLSLGTYHRAVGQADHHLHRKAVLLQVQACQLPVEWVLLLDLWRQETSWYLGPVLSWRLPQAAPLTACSPAGLPAPLPGTRY